ncbi:MAG: hypothetical protein AAGH76_16870 [Pseudomonadota bacterium]
MDATATDIALYGNKTVGGFVAVIHNNAERKTFLVDNRPAINVLSEKLRISLQFAGT